MGASNLLARNDICRAWGYLDALLEMNYGFSIFYRLIRDKLGICVIPVAVPWPRIKLSPRGH